MYVSRVKGVLEAATGKKDLLDVVLIQMVSIVRDGKEVRSSKRSGNFVTLDDLVDEVGSDAVRFLFLTRVVNSHLKFDINLAIEKSNENPVYYVQYAHARICSIFRKIEDVSLEGADLSLMKDDAKALELTLILLDFPDLVKLAALKLEPHQIVFYLMDVAAEFHSYYNANPILKQEEGLRNARLCLIDAVRVVIANGLEILGVSAPEVMESLED